MSSLAKLSPLKTGLNQRPLLSYNSSWGFVIITVGLYWDIQRQLNPLTDLMRGKSSSIQFKATQAEAFQELKNRLVLAPVLKVYDLELPIRIQSDASKLTVGSILEQQYSGNWHPVEYFSKRLNDAKS